MESTSKRHKFESQDSPGTSSSTVNQESPNGEWEEKDLPILANINEVKVYHYLLKLDFDLERRDVDGIAVIFFEPKYSSGFQSLKNLILDSNSLKVDKVFQLRQPDQFAPNNGGVTLTPKNFYKSNSTDWFTVGGHKLEFSEERWSITVCGWPDYSDDKKPPSPSIIRIHYKVLPSSPSLNWYPTDSVDLDYDKSSKCVLTAGSSINNRGLFPCQEPPTAMATWECFVKTSKDYEHILSSDEEGEVVMEDLISRTTYFYCSMVLPMSTFALVIAKFPLRYPQLLLNPTLVGPNVGPQVQCNHEPYYCRIRDRICLSNDSISVRFFSVSSNVKIDIDQLSSILERTVKSLFETLGPFPFARIDLVIVPNFFHALGLCSPNLIFLSPSLFHGKGPLYYYRIPHEISHFWFGLLIGGLSLEEEFLSEGFATFMEEILYKKIFRDVKTDQEIQEEINAKTCLHLITLQNELANTDSNLHILSHDTLNSESISVKFGLEPMKQFMQVHYLKGYFLLKYLAYLVGEHNFLEFVKEYALIFHGQLVTSKILLSSYYNKFSTILDSHPKFKSMKPLENEWLYQRNIPEPFRSCDILSGGGNQEFLEMISSSRSTFVKIQDLVVMLQANPPDKNGIENCLKTLSNSKLNLLLEKVIHMISNEVMGESKQLLYQNLMESSISDETSQNPEVIHRVCELIILNNDVSRLHTLENFLCRHQSLGLYLYGELMISEKYRFQRLARKLYKKQSHVLDLAQNKVLHDMIF